MPEASDDVLFEEVKVFVAEMTATKVNKLHRDTTLRDDLGCDGDDGIEFIDAFSDRFHLDMDSFNYSLYFGPEGFNPIAYIFYLLFDRDQLKYIPISIDDLTNAARDKKWSKP